jgi:hypothetical protein
MPSTWPMSQDSLELWHIIAIPQASVRTVCEPSNSDKHFTSLRAAFLTVTALSDEYQS